MLANIINPATAIRRFEENHQREIHENGDQNTLISHIMGNPEAKRRIWTITGDQLTCTFNDTTDEQKHGRRVQKFIKSWQT